ncbi:class I SAM-dependent methyltransferase [Bradyrhizobium sp. CCGUVB23]|uniref:class I SAM-dependent methyltransferase n=1 Tax=Bradyrhizobium sp. CCGUVB23 TaxID=2949630 RepID=UPI0020B439E1|nr:class I SAM-dependent methyltransferase [Bradyrhizobium sp. CCGUVB23]MCP3460062.1 class I SAM-dependent methyltransferase [Bradyrhizobium sp. CCGUVB23]
MTYSLETLRRTIGRLPVLGPMARQLYRAIVPNRFSSAEYWEQRYAHGGNSGAGSYGRLAQFKAETINKFVKGREIRTIIEFGSGDGAQLELARYPTYTGVDVSASAIELCKTKFKNDPTKQFLLASSGDASKARAELAMSLDVIYHLIEDTVYDAYMKSLVSAAEKYICIYSSNYVRLAPATHVRHRVFTEWIAANAPTWKLILKVDNPFPRDPENPDQTSWADFYFYERLQS